MGIMDFLKKQFIDVIDWVEEGSGVLSFRYPMQDREIQNGAILTVRESQLGVFVNEGVIADVFKPGKFKLTTQTLPILTNLKNWDKAFASPFKSDVYFFSTREQLDQKWGTQMPITFRDKEMGAIRLRAHGTFSYKLVDPKVFYQKCSATNSVFTVEQMDGQLRSGILTAIGSYLGNGKVPFLEMASNQMEFSKNLKESCAPLFTNYGLDLQAFFVQSLSLPEELQKYLDKASSMRMLGDLGKYMQFQTAESIPDAAKNPGGLASAGVGLGAGVAMGQAMGAAFGNTGGGAKTEEDSFAKIDKLHEMMKKGVITQAEFDAKKAELLKKI